MDLAAQPLPKKLYDRAIADGVTKINLNFSGGDDQGYLNIDLDYKDYKARKDHGLANDIEKWAWSVYEYSGAGGGDAYGDDIIYDLVKGTMTSQDWHMTRQEGSAFESELSTWEFYE